MKNRDENITYRSTRLPRITGGLLTIMMSWLLMMVAYGCSRHDPDKYIFASEESIKTDRLFTLTVQGEDRKSVV